MRERGGARLHREWSRGQQFRHIVTPNGLHSRNYICGCPPRVSTITGGCVEQICFYTSHRTVGQAVPYPVLVAVTGTPGVSICYDLYRLSDILANWKISGGAQRPVRIERCEILWRKRRSRVPWSSHCDSRRVCDVNCAGDSVVHTRV